MIGIEQAAVKYPTQQRILGDEVQVGTRIFASGFPGFVFVVPDRLEKKKQMDTHGF